MILITGDTHGFRDIDKLVKIPNEVLSSLSKKDYLIILGDVGLLWDDSVKSKELLHFFESQPYTTLYIDGNHENFNELYKCKEVKKFGDYVHKVGSNVYHLKRGCVYNICGKIIFTFGGAYSCDRDIRIPGKSWWSEEVPNRDEILQGKKALKAYNNKVHYILTHDCPCIVRRMININGDFMLDTPDKEFQSFLTDLNANTNFKHWYFGHYHLDMKVANKYTVMFNNILELR